MKRRFLPHVCDNPKCKRLILPPFSDEFVRYDCINKIFITVCGKCKDNE